MVNCINLIIEMSPRLVLGWENVPCVAEVVNRSLKADCTDFTHGGQVQGDKALMGGTHEGDIDLMGGPNFDRLYHKLKVLLMLSCNYMMQFIDYDSIKTR